MRKPLLTFRIEQVIKYLSEFQPRDDASASSVISDARARVRVSLDLLRDLLDDVQAGRALRQTRQGGK